MSKKEKVLVFTNIITAILLVVCGGALLLIKLNDKTARCVDAPEIKEDTSEKNEESTNKQESTDNTIEGSLIYSDSTEDNKIYLMKDKTLKLVSENLGNKEISKNVIKTYDIYAGQSDVCEGNRWIIAETEDSKYVAISIDALSCGERIETVNVSDELKKLNVTGTISIYDTKTFINQYEPLSYKVYAINEDGKSTEITSIFE